jgi:hypothetical protein
MPACSHLPTSEAKLEFINLSCGTGKPAKQFYIEHSDKNWHDETTATPHLLHSNLEGLFMDGSHPMDQPYRK